MVGVGRQEPADTHTKGKDTTMTPLDTETEARITRETEAILTDALIDRLTRMDDPTRDYAQVVLTAPDDARTGAFAMSIEPDDAEAIAGFLEEHCDRTPDHADELAARFTYLWNKGRYTQAAESLKDICRADYRAVIPLSH